MKTYGIIGFPLTHSFSGHYFTEKFIKEGITDCVYKTFPIHSIAEFPHLLRNNPDLVGLNVTIPHKQSVFQYLHTATGIPPGLKACNCIKIKGGKALGYNTDIAGFENSILPLLKEQHKHALILGNGGAAEAVKFVLQRLNIGYQVVSRNLHNGSTLTYADLDEKIITEHSLVINTTPLGTFPRNNSCPDIPYQFLHSKHLLYDLVYNPATTLFLQKGAEQGATIKNGFEMLVIQAEESWKLWNED